MRHYLALLPRMRYAWGGSLFVSASINLEDPMFQWANFEAAAPMLAAQGRELIERFRFVLVGTIRSDGTPRISPVEAHIVDGHLMLVMIPNTLKARDLLRDPRILVNSPITHPDDPNTELKLRGRVVEIRDQALQRRPLMRLRPRADGDHRQAGTSSPSTSRMPPSSPGRVAY